MSLSNNNNATAKPIPDAQIREAALQLENSYAVQAPAGSGKTELLSLRVLKLLAISQQPEEVLAITFTRKAANEMSNRIIETLTWADNCAELSASASPLESQKYHIAKSVLAQNQRQGWQLLQSPNRLRIQTIDGFCHYLSSRLPVLSGFGSQPNVSEQMDDCYRSAVLDTLALINDDGQIADDLSALYLHLDNNLGNVENLLVNLLKQRDQWLEPILEISTANDAYQQYLNTALDELISDKLSALSEHLYSYKDELLALVDYAATRLSEAGQTSNITLCQNLSCLPATDSSALPQWLGLCELLLVKSDKAGWRKKLTKKEGFPPKSAAADAQQKELFERSKQRMTQLLGELSHSNNSEILEQMAYVRLLPDRDSKQESWQFLGSLSRILPVLIAQLNVSFSRLNRVDHTQISFAAAMALGSETEPTDLALILDYKIKHILVDEFQDTSSTQFRLLEKLTAGWEPGDGRSLFIVGDAMQSCYLFRNANVGLFLKAREQGIGNIDLIPLDLVSNFRSKAGIVNWVNKVFKAAFPERADIARGAVSYSASQAFDGDSNDTLVQTHLISHTQEQVEAAKLSEAAQVVAKIQALSEANSAHSIAVLVRSRSHLKQLLPAFREANIAWQATDIDPLGSLTVSQDLFTLTSCLHNLADKLAWTALLRAPWCGLSSGDLLKLINQSSSDDLANNASIWHLLAQASHLESLSEASRQRLNSVYSIMAYVLSYKRNWPLSKLVNTAWLLLKGPDIYNSSLELAASEAFLRLLSDHESSAIDLVRFQERLDKSYVNDDSQPQDNAVQIMTIHKAKGLEFDHVLLPGLSRSSRADDKPLLIWHEHINAHNETRLFLSTLNAVHETQSASSLYELLRHEKKLKHNLESARLLYIAITRAKRSCTLLATMLIDDEDAQEAVLRAPPARSLLATIWSSLNTVDIPPASVLPVHELGTVNKLDEPQTTEVMSVLTGSPIRRLITPPSAIALPPSASHSDDGPSSESERKSETDSDDSYTASASLHAATLDPSGVLELGIELVDVDEETEVAPTALSSAMGVIIHRALENHVRFSSSYADDQIHSHRALWAIQLNPYCDAATLQASLNFIQDSVRRCIENTDINWVFDPQLNDSKTEVAINSFVNERLQIHIIDRSFIDAQGVRWIIDYKSTPKHPKQSLQAFLSKHSQLHSQQLRHYKKLYSNMEHRVSKTALLFTSLAILHEVQL